LSTATASANDVFSQLPDGINGYFADSTGSFPAQRVADDFSLGAGTTIRSLTFWGGYFPHQASIPDDDFTLTLYSDGGGIPGGVIHSTSLSALSRTDTGIDLFGTDEYIYNANLTTPVAVSGSTTYFLSITNNTGLGAFGASWFWETGTGHGLLTFSADGGGTWSAFGGDQAFILSSKAVPAPGAIALLGLVGLVSRRRRSA
jgi:MYXO-CTERM domain-containing protein